LRNFFKHSTFIQKNFANRGRQSLSFLYNTILCYIAWQRLNLLDKREALASIAKKKEKTIANRAESEGEIIYTTPDQVMKAYNELLISPKFGKNRLQYDRHFYSRFWIDRNSS